MKIRVECYAGHRGEETPRRLFLDERSIEIIEVIDRWFGPDHRYFKVQGSDRATYVIRQDIPTHCWELTMYQTPPLCNERGA